MVQTLGALGSCDNDFNVFGERLGEPEGNIGLFSSFAINKLVDCFNDDDDFVVDLLSAVDDELLFDFGAADIEPVGEKLPDVFFKQVDILFEFESFPEFDDDPVEGVEIIAVVTAVAGEVHDGEGFLLSEGAVGLVLLPVDKNGLNAAPWLRFEH